MEIRARRERTRARIAAALAERPDIDIDRLARFEAVLRGYREREWAGQTPLLRRLEAARPEVEALERWARGLPKRQQRDGSRIRRALTFLRSYGRICALGMDVVPVEERSELIALLAIEYRWCFAAAGTTLRVFKVEIGRTGGR